MIMTKLSEYRREIKANIERVWENVLDFEHLPSLHATTFAYCELDEAGDWGWRVWSDPEHRGYIELVVADPRSYVARSFRSGRQMSEILTVLEPHGDSTGIHVTFQAPDVDPDRVDEFGRTYIELYTRLWDEDEAMMVLRQRRLDEQRDAPRELTLGTLAEVKTNLPQTVRVGRGEFILRDVDDELVIHSSICPHLLGPLEESAVKEGRVRCPWHGYEFDIASGKCVSPSTANCKLTPAPQIDVVNGVVKVRVR